MHRMLACAACALVVVAGCSRSPEQLTIAAVKQLGGRVKLDRDSHAAEVDLNHSAATDADLAPLLGARRASFAQPEPNAGHRPRAVWPGRLPKTGNLVSRRQPARRPRPGRSRPPHVTAHVAPRPHANHRRRPASTQKLACSAHAVARRHPNHRRRPRAPPRTGRNQRFSPAAHQDDLRRRSAIATIAAESAHRTLTTRNEPLRTRRGKKRALFRNHRRPPVFARSPPCKFAPISDTWGVNCARACRHPPHRKPLKSAR